MSTHLIRTDQPSGESMGLLEAFNHLGRHSLRKTSAIAQMRQSRNSASHVLVGMLLAPFAVSLIKHDMKLAFAAACVAGGYIAAGHVYNRLERGKPLGPLSALLSKGDIPLFVGGNAYMLNTYVQDILSPSTPTSAGDPFLILMASAALWAGLPKISRDRRKSSGGPSSPPLLPPPGAR